MKPRKKFIYQLLPRLLGNTKTTNIPNGTLEENGCGKFNDISDIFLNQLKESGYTHVWLIGILAHASATDYTRFGIPAEYPEIVKGNAGSPYALRDVYDVDPDLAVNVADRMGEFERWWRGSPCWPERDYRFHSQPPGKELQICQPSRRG